MRTITLRRPVYLYITLLAGLVAVAIWQIRSARGVPRVVVAAARTAPLVVDWSATGYVESRTAKVSAPQVGRIAAVEVREGDVVRPGQVLARLVSGTEEAAARVQEAGVRAAEAQAEAARAAAQEAGEAHASRVEQAEAQVAAARARHQQAQAALNRDRGVARAYLDVARAEADAAGAQLADLESGARPEEIAQAEAAAAAAEATAERARTEKARQERLLAEGAVPRRAVEDATEALAQAEASLKRAREQLALLRKGSRPQEIAAARARLRAAREQVASAEAQLTGLATMERAVEEAAAAVRAAAAALAGARAEESRVDALDYEARAAEARVRQGAAGFEQAKAGLADRVVTAPFAGTIGRRYVDPGDVASPPQPLFTVVESGRTWVAAEVDAQDLAAVATGQRVAITAPAYPGRTFPGEVEVVGSEAIPQTEEVRTSARIVRIRVSLAPTPEPERALLKTGMEVDVAGKATLVAEALLVPNDALLTDAAGMYVFVVQDGRVAKRRVRAGHANGRFTEILSGLRAGESVVVKGKEGLSPGKRVLQTAD